MAYLRYLNIILLSSLALGSLKARQDEYAVFEGSKLRINAVRYSSDSDDYDTSDPGDDYYSVDSGDTTYATETYDDSGYYSTLSDIASSHSAFVSSADAAISSDEIQPTLGGGYVTPTASYYDYYSSLSAAYTSGTPSYDSAYYSSLSAAYTSGSAAFASATRAAVCLPDGIEIYR